MESLKARRFSSKPWWDAGVREQRYETRRVRWRRAKAGWSGKAQKHNQTKKEGVLVIVRRRDSIK